MDEKRVMVMENRRRLEKDERAGQVQRSVQKSGALEKMKAVKRAASF